MKKLLMPCAVLVAALLASSCEFEEPERYFELNGVEYDLEVGLIDDFGTNSTGVIDTRFHAISFRSSEAFPENYITFLLGSFSASDLVTGDYTYHFPADKGTFSDIRIGTNLNYDHNDIAVSGMVFADDMVNYDGVVRISTTSNGDLDFFIDINIDVKEEYLDEFPQNHYDFICEFNDDILWDTRDVHLETY